MSIYLRGLRRGFWGWCRLRGFSDIFLSHSSIRSYLVEHESDTGDWFHQKQLLMPPSVPGRQARG